MHGWFLDMLGYFKHPQMLYSLYVKVFAGEKLYIPGYKELKLAKKPSHSYRAIDFIPRGCTQNCNYSQKKFGVLQFDCIPIISNLKISILKPKIQVKHDKI